MAKRPIDKVSCDNRALSPRRPPMQLTLVPAGSSNEAELPQLSRRIRLIPAGESGWRSTVLPATKEEVEDALVEKEVVAAARQYFLSRHD